MRCTRARTRLAVSTLALHFEHARLIAIVQMCTAALSPDGPQCYRQRSCPYGCSAGMPSNNSKGNDCDGDKGGPEQREFDAAEVLQHHWHQKHGRGGRCVRLLSGRCGSLPPHRKDCGRSSECPKPPSRKSGSYDGNANAERVQHGVGGHSGHRVSTYAHRRVNSATVLISMRGWPPRRCWCYRRGARCASCRLGLGPTVRRRRGPRQCWFRQ